MKPHYKSMLTFVVPLLMGLICLPLWVDVSALNKQQDPTQLIKEEAMTTAPGVPVSPGSVPRSTISPGQNGQEEEDENEPYSEIDVRTLQRLKRYPYVLPRSQPNTTAQDGSADKRGTVSPLAPTLLTNFEGVDNSGQPDGLLHRPPDPEVAAGPNHVLVVANSSFAIYTKSGTLLQEHGFSDWFNNVCSTCVCAPPDCSFFDPRVTYDPLANHWIMLALYRKDATQESKFLLSVSQTSDPTASWWNYKLEGVLNVNGENTWADYPDLSFDGITANTGGAIYITTNQFPFVSSPPFRTAVLQMLPKASLYSGAGLNYWRASGRTNTDGSQAFTLRAARSYGTPGFEYLINTKSPSNFVSLWKVVPTYPPTAVNWTLQSSINVGSYTVAPSARQPGCADTLPTLDNRITGGVVWRNNRIYAAFTEAHNWGSGIVAAVRYLKINTSSNAVEISETYGADGLDYYFPAITTDSSENIVLAFARSSPSEFAGVRFTGRLASETTTQGSALLKAGEECITGARWGDYFGAAVDPSDSSKVWIYGEWAKNLSDATAVWDWGTWIGQVRFGGGCSFAVGQGTSGSEATAFLNAYNSAGGQASLGCPTQSVQFNGFTSFAGTTGHYQLCENGDLEYMTNGSRVGQAYGVVNPLYNKWASLGFDSSNPVGYPIGNLSSQSTSCFGTNLDFQQFEGGALEHHLSGPRAGAVYEVHGAIYTKWGQKGFASCPLGLPISDERSAPFSGVTGQSGRVSDFEGGHIHWRTGAGSAYETHGAIDARYVSLGTSGSFLGFPISDEYVASTGFARNDFEGGFITTVDGVNYLAFRYSYTLTVASSNPASGVGITLSPNDINGQGSGTTQFTRTYNTFTAVTLTAPSVVAGHSFQKWQRDGVDVSTNLSTSITIDAGHTMTAVYLSAPTHGTQTIGLYRASISTFYLRNSNTAGFPDIIAPFGDGPNGDIPIVGDWDGNGTMTIGVYRPSTSTFYLRNSNTAGFPDIIAPFGDGPHGDIPIAGDWDGNGTWTIGVYRPSTSVFYLRNSNTAGFPDIIAPFGAPGDLPVVGDWDGNGTVTIGLYRASISTFYLRNSNTAGFPDIIAPFGDGPHGDIPMVGDWDGSGTWTIGVYRPSTSVFYLRNSNTAGFPDIIAPFGAVGDKGIVGNWDGQ